MWDQTYGLFGPSGRIHRISFSRSLLDHLGRTFLGGDYTIRPLRFRTGRRLAPGETSSTGLYAICDSRSGRTLRISMFREVAEFLTGDDSRYIAECGIIPS